ncbi:MAG: hypothetical protein ACXAEX_08555 [Promethearchaeota archaeon]
MAWTPPSKFIVLLTFLCMAFGIFILIDMWFISPSILPAFSIATYDGWQIIALALFFLTWFLFFIAVKLKGL